MYLTFMRIYGKYRFIHAFCDFQRALSSVHFYHKSFLFVVDDKDIPGFSWKSIDCCCRDYESLDDLPAEPIAIWHPTSQRFTLASNYIPAYAGSEISYLNDGRAIQDRLLRIVGIVFND